ncbi:MAG: cation transporter [Sulfolobales archaeon]
MLREIAVRKLGRLYRMVAVFKILAFCSFTYGVVGILLYLIVARSNLILVDSMLWIVDSMLYVALFFILKIISFKTLSSYRYELLRVEDVLSLVISIVAISITLSLIPSSFTNSEITPPVFTLYLIGSGLLSYWFSRYVRSNGSYGRVLMSTTAVKTWLDALVELVSATAILMSYISNNAIIENMAFLAVSAYAIKYYFTMAWRSALNLLDVNYPRDLKFKVRKVVSKYEGVRVRRVLIRNLGSFVEVELWLVLPNNLTLTSAQQVISKIAREVLTRIPEIIKVLVIALPGITKLESPVSVNALGRNSFRNSD